MIFLLSLLPLEPPTLLVPIGNVTGENFTLPDVNKFRYNFLLFVVIVEGILGVQTGSGSHML